MMHFGKDKKTKEFYSLKVLICEDSENFQHHFMANDVLRPNIATREGGLALRKITDVQSVQGSDDEVLETGKRKAIPRDLWLPGGLVMLCCFNNHLSYVFEFSTFAIFFKEYHGWNEAVWASFAQTAGDLAAAIISLELISVRREKWDTFGAFSDSHTVARSW